MTRLLIFSDPICPWCYVGKKRLDAAISTCPDAVLDIRYRPFMLNPDMPDEGMERRAYLEGKFGGAEGASQAYAPVAEAFKAEGIDADATAMARTPSTLNAHRAIYWAELEGFGSEMVDGLFGAYFEDQRDISDPEVLADISDSIGMDAALVLRLLASDADIDTVRDADAEARRIGIQAVPTVVVAGQHAVSGAQPTELWIKVLTEIAEAQA